MGNIKFKSNVTMASTHIRLLRIFRSIDNLLCDSLTVFPCLVQKIIVAELELVSIK